MVVDIDEYDMKPFSEAPKFCLLFYCHECSEEIGISFIHLITYYLETSLCLLNNFAVDRENFEAKKTHYDNLYRIVAFCENRLDCRRVQLLGYFGEIFDRSKCVNAKSSCDNCVAQVRYLIG